MKLLFNYLWAIALICSSTIAAQENNKLTIFAGQAQAGLLDGHTLDLAQFEQPMGLEIKPGGGLYVTDLKNTAVRQIKKGVVSTLQETGCPTADVATDPTGNLYLVQTQCHRIMKLSPDGKLEVIAGTSVPSLSPDGSVAAKSAVFGPLGVAWSNGRIYFTEHASKSIRYIDEQGLLHTLMVQPESAEVLPLAIPKGIAFAPDGALYVADPGSNRVQRIDNSGIMTTYAGDGFGCPQEEEKLEDISLRTPVDVAIAPNGKVFIAEVSRTHPLIETDPITRQVNRIEFGVPIDYTIGEMYPGGLTVDAENTVYLSGQNTYQLYSYTPKPQVKLREETAAKLSIKVSPNPASQNFMVNIDPPLSNQGTLQVVNAHGQLVLERKLDIGAQQEQVFLPLLHSGSYRVILKSAAQLASAPVILQNKD